MKFKNSPGRRNFLKATAGMAAMPLVITPRGQTAIKQDNRIVEENNKPGTVEWQLQYTRFDDPITLASYPLNRQLRSSAIEGYVSRASVLPGETIDIMVSLAQLLSGSVSELKERKMTGFLRKRSAL